MKDTIRGPYELDIQEYSEEVVNNGRGNPNHDPGSGRFSTGGGSANKITKIVREDKYQKQVEYNIINDKMAVSSTATVQKQNGILGIKKGDVGINTSASGPLSVKDAKSFHSMVGKANSEAIKLNKKYGVSSLPNSKTKITKDVKESDHIKEITFEMKNDRVWQRSTVTKFKADGVLGIKAGDTSVNTSASGSLRADDSQTYHSMVGKAIKEAEKI